MKIITYASPLDGAAVYLTAEQFKAPEVQKYFTQKVTQTNADYFSSNSKDGRKEDWDARMKLINEGAAIVVEPTEKGLIACLEGYVQVMDKNNQRNLLVDGKCDPAERIPNYSVPKSEKGIAEANYLFPFAQVLTVNKLEDLEKVNNALLYQPLKRDKK
ncbi:hypothetical protein HZC32_02810 [Candidatus Woesearchaeota archaeon]|nr:hypothetical protein [Candidatus Woesearchaeota archaeon]